jgi:hypothetical protein
MSGDLDKPGERHLDASSNMGRRERTHGMTHEEDLVVFEFLVDVFLNKMSLETVANVCSEMDEMSLGSYSLGF